MPEEYQEYEPVQEPAVEAPAPVEGMPRQWSWSSTTLTYAALAVLAAGFGIWFLMSYTGARARAIAGGSDDVGE
jgi:hypothetical protein